MQWLEPWCDVRDLGPEFATTFELVLTREVGPGHPLHGISVAAIAKRDGTDDVLFKLLDGSERVAVVHLTWTQSPPETPPWPITELFQSLDAFSSKQMLPDHTGLLY
jgi:hypothetical protein